MSPGIGAPRAPGPTSRVPPEAAGAVRRACLHSAHYRFDAAARSCHRWRGFLSQKTMYEKIGEKLLPWPGFLMRMALSFGITLLIVFFALGAGVLGYHVIAGLPWVDALLNAAMILTGMGPVDPMKDTASKLFATAYALFSGVGIVLAPVFHRVVHAFHIDD